MKKGLLDKVAKAVSTIPTSNVFARLGEQRALAFSLQDAV